MNPATASAVKTALCGCVFLVVMALVLLQLVGGTAYTPVTFRESRPRAYWRIIGVYSVVLVAVAAIFILWR
jgi:hypothetical protein